MTEEISIPTHFHEKRYNSLNNHLRVLFGEKVFKIALDGGFDCPNRDGTAGRGGCVFCSPRGSGDFAGGRAETLEEQFEEIRKRMHTKWKSGKYIGYFQAFSNTHAPVDELRFQHEQILAFPDVVGVSIATRPDCLPGDVMDYLSNLNKRTYLWVELGLQTVHNRTANAINRCYDMDCYVNAVSELRGRGIQICTHIIDGLPGEGREMMVETARQAAQHGVQGIKIHLLHLLKGTPLIDLYEKNALQLLEKDEYVNIVCDQLEVLPPDMVIHRLTGDGPPDSLIGPMWSLKKWEVLNAIDRELEIRSSFQGKLVAPS
ncbi:TIGR01212 family radical SAM protein [Candidatus Hydrogenedentota bacterium]